MNAVDETFWAWLAGFVDGEGCIRTYSNGSTLTIGQKDDAPLIHIKEVLGLSNKLTWNSKIWYLQINRQQHLQYVLTHMIPYMWVKKADAQLVLEHVESRMLARGLSNWDPQERGR